MNTKEDKLCLRWADFQENTVSAFGELRGDKEFTDITLACEDGQQVEAHKVILASSSPFFLNLLRRNKHPHPLIYMMGLKSEDIVAMIDFLYYGEANVYQENLDSFLAVAEELQLKGLTKDEQAKEETVAPIIPKKKQSLIPKRETMKHHKKDYCIETSIDSTVESTKFESVQSNENPLERTDFTDLQDLDEQIKSMMEVSEHILGGVHGNTKVRVCKVCGKEGYQSDIKKHIESNHITGVFHTCNICGNTFRTRASLSTHVSKH